MRRFVLPLILCAPLVMADVETQCNIVSCNAGSKVTTYSKKDDFYYGCPTRELAEYTMFVIGHLAFLATFGLLPNMNISPYYRRTGARR